jgi:hypothetical protein
MSTFLFTRRLAFWIPLSYISLFRLTFCEIETIEAVTRVSPSSGDFPNDDCRKFLNLLDRTQILLEYPLRPEIVAFLSFPEELKTFT